MAVEENVDRGQEDHEQRDPLRLAQALERLAEARRQRERHVSTAERLDRSSPPVRRELEQRGRIGQPPPPVVELRGERLSLKPLPLPVGEVAILDGRLRKRRWPASGEGVVECHELRKKHGECRDAIEDDLVQGHMQSVLRVGKPDQRGSEQRTRNQVEGSPDLLSGQTQGFRFALCLGELPEIDDR